MADNIKAMHTEYIHKIEELTFHSAVFRNPDFDLKLSPLNKKFLEVILHLFSDFTLLKVIQIIENHTY